MDLPHDIPADAQEVWHQFRLAETLNAIWTLGQGSSVRAAGIAHYLGVSEQEAFNWLLMNGQGFWEASNVECSRWQPLEGRANRRQARF